VYTSLPHVVLLHVVSQCSLTLKMEDLIFNSCVQCNQHIRLWATSSS